MTSERVPLTDEQREALTTFAQELPPYRPPMPVMPLPDSYRIAGLEAEVAGLRAELAEVRRQTLGYRWANSPDSEDRATAYQAGVE